MTALTRARDAVERRLLTTVLGLPEGLQRRLAGRPVELDGDTLATDLQLMLRLKKAARLPAVETLPIDKARAATRHEASQAGGDQPIGEVRDLTAAAERLLAGTPLRSASGKLTSSELITESGLRRDVVYGEHKDLVDDFKARVKAQDATPSSIARISDENRALRNANDALKKQLAEEHETTKTLTKIVAELSLEVHQAREELAALRQVTHIGTQSPHDRLPGT